MSLCGGGGNGGGAHVVRMDPSRTGGGGGALQRLQSSVAVCFKFGLGSLHRLELVMSQPAWDTTTVGTSTNITQTKTREN